MNNNTISRILMGLLVMYIAITPVLASININGSTGIASGFTNILDNFGLSYLHKNLTNPCGNGVGGDYAYLICIVGTTTYAKNGTTGAIDYRGTNDIGEILNSLPNYTNILITPGRYNISTTAQKHDIDIKCDDTVRNTQISAVPGFTDYFFNFTRAGAINVIKGCTFNLQPNGVFINDVVDSWYLRLEDVYVNGKLGNREPYSATNSSNYIIKVNNSGSLRFWHLVLMNVTHGIFLETIADSTIADSVIAGAVDESIIMNNTVGLFVSSSSAFALTNSAVNQFDLNIDLIGANNKLSFIGNTIEYAGKHGFQLYSGATSGQALQETIIANNRIQFNGQNINYGSGVYISNGTVNITALNIHDNIMGNPHLANCCNRTQSQVYGIFETTANVTQSKYHDNIMQNVSLPVSLMSTVTRVSYNNYGVSPYNFGNSASFPVAFGGGDTYYNSSSNLMCYASAAGTANWRYVFNGTSGC